MHEFWKKLQFKLDKAGGGEGGGGGSGAAAGGGEGSGGGLGLADGGAAGGAGAKGGAGTADGGKGEPAAGSGDKGGGGANDKGGSQNWRDSLPDALKGSKSLEKFKDATALAQSYLSLESAAGKKGLIVPSDTAPQEEWDAFHKALGRPDAADKYDLKNPEGVSLKIDENFQKGYKEFAHKLGLNGKQAAGLYEWYLKEGDGRVKAGTQASANARTQLLDGLKKDWGDKFAGNVNDAKLAIDSVVPDDLKKWFKESGHSEDPRMARIFHAVASKFMGEDVLRGEGEGTIGTTMQDLEKELLELDSPSSARFGKDDLLRQRANERAIELRKELKRLRSRSAG